MPARPAARQRLADLMERRRLDLGLTWREVAEAGNISYEVIRAIRNGNSQIRPLSQHGIEVGLRWGGGSVQSILDGGDPLPVAPLAVTPATPEPPLEAPDSGDDVRGAVVAALYGPAERRIWSHVRRCLAGTPAGRELFSVPAEAATWPPEAPDGLSGGAPFDLTEKARELLDATPAIDLFTDPYEVIVWRMNRLPYRKRVGMIRELREAVREPAWRAPRPSSARRVGLEEPPHGLTA